MTQPDVHISDNTAWIAYVNEGSITDASGTMNQKWSESAFLQKQAGIWKIVFMLSTRVPCCLKRTMAIEIEAPIAIATIGIVLNRLASA